MTENIGDAIAVFRRYHEDLFEKAGFVKLGRRQ